MLHLVCACYSRWASGLLFLRQRPIESSFRTTMGRGGGRGCGGLPTMGAREPFISEDPVVLLEDIFRDLHQEGQQINMASPEVAEEDLPEESPVMPVVTGPSSVFNISPTRQTSSSSSHHYAKLLSVRIVQPSEGAPISGNLSLDSHPFFMRLLIRAIQSLFITGSYLSRVTSSRCAQFHGPS